MLLYVSSIQYYVCIMNILDSILSEIQDAKQKLSTLQQTVPVQTPEIIDTKKLCLRLGISEPTAIKEEKAITSF